MRNAAGDLATTRAVTSATMTPSPPCVEEQNLTTLPAPCAAMGRCNNGWVEETQDVAGKALTILRRTSAAATGCMPCALERRIILTLVSVADQS